MTEALQLDREPSPGLRRPVRHSVAPTPQSGSRLPDEDGIRVRNEKQCIMNKSDIIRHVAGETGLTRSASTTAAFKPGKALRDALNQR